MSIIHAKSVKVAAKFNDHESIGQGMLHGNLIWQTVKRSVRPASLLNCAAIPDLLLHGVQIGLDGEAGGRAEEWGGRGRWIPAAEQSQQPSASLKRSVVMYLFKARA